MKKTFFGLAAYLFGGISIIFLGLFIATEGTADSYRMVVFVTGAIALVFYWKS